MIGFRRFLLLFLRFSLLCHFSSRNACSHPIVLRASQVRYYGNKCLHDSQLACVLCLLSLKFCRRGRKDSLNRYLRPQIPAYMHYDTQCIILKSIIEIKQCLLLVVSSMFLYPGHIQRLGLRLSYHRQIAGLFNINYSIRIRESFAYDLYSVCVTLASFILLFFNQILDSQS